MSKMNKQNLLQKYVDHKLNSIRADMDDLSDYIENYTGDKHLVYSKDLKKWGEDPKAFAQEFKPTFKQIKDAIKRSPLLDVLAERYKKAVIKCIPIDIFYNVIDMDRDTITEEWEETENHAAMLAVKKKLDKVNLSEHEKKLLKKML